MTFEIRPILHAPASERVDLANESFLKRLFAPKEEKFKILTPDLIGIANGKPDRVYVVGDIHGCRKELEALLHILENHEDFSPRDLIVFVGDYVDRGSDSAGVLDLLIEFSRDHPNCVFLRGNHDIQFLTFVVGDPKLRGVFLEDGGRETLESYNLAANSTQARLIQSIPESHLQFLQELKNLLIIQNFALSHASVANERELEFQRPHDLTFGRCGNEKEAHPSGKISVFGHYSVEKIIARKRARRLCLDTGCVVGRKLSCVEIFSDRVLSVSFGDLQFSEDRVPWK